MTTNSRSFHDPSWGFALGEEHDLIGESWRRGRGPAMLDLIPARLLLRALGIDDLTRVVLLAPR